MSEFGQSLPAVPKAYTDASSYSYTKSEFVSHLTRALETVGMVPLRGLWPYDPTSEPGRVLSDGSSPDLFPFDYPDDSTFVVNGELWRPCIVVFNFHGDYGFSTPDAENYNDTGVFDAIRRDGPATQDSIYITNRHRNPATTNYGFGTGTALGYIYDHSGAYVTLANWKPYPSHTPTFNSNVLAVNHWFVYLGRSGLFIYVGTGTDRVQFGSHLACGFVFAGGRLAGRELTVDVNLNRINPVVPLYFRSENANESVLAQWKSLNGYLESTIHGMQYDLKSQLEPVRCLIYNLENIEIPIFPAYVPWTTPSPRPVLSGGGAHILGRAIIIPTSKEDNSGDIYGPVNNALSTSQPRPGYGEVFTAPDFRLCDLAAPIGETEDPITLKNWYITPTYNTNQLIALYFENATSVSALDSLSLTLVSDDYYRMDGTPSMSFPNLGGGIVAPSVTTTTTVPTWEIWDETDSGDLIFAFNDPAYNGGFAETVTEWVLTPGNADQPDTLYRVEFEARNRNAAVTEGNCPLEFEAYINGSWETLLTLNSAGENTGAAAYNFQTFTLTVPIDSTNTGSRTIKVRWVATRSLSSQEGNTVTVQNVHLKKFRYL